MFIGCVGILVLATLSLVSCSDNKVIDPGFQVPPPPHLETFDLKVSEHWSHPLGYPFFHDVRPAIEDDIVYVAADTVLFSVKLPTGQILWRKRLNNENSISGWSIVMDEQNLYLHDAHWVSAFDKNSGKLVWELPLDNLETVDLAEMVQTADHLFLGRIEEVIKINKSNGSIDATFPISDRLQESNVPWWAFDVQVSEDGLLYVPATLHSNAELGNSRGRVYSFDIETQEIRWQYDIPFDTIYLPEWNTDRIEQAAVQNCRIWEDLLIVPSREKIQALNRFTGELVWEKQYLLKYQFDKTIQIKDGIIYLGTTNSDVIFALNALDGSLIWENFLESGGLVNMTLHDGKIFTGDWSRIYIVDQASGELLWRGYPPGYLTTGDKYKSPIVTTENFFVSLGNQKVYCMNYE